MELYKKVHESRDLRLFWLFVLRLQSLVMGLCFFLRNFDA